MLTAQQEKFRRSFLHPLKQRLFFLRELPMALLAGVRLVALHEDVAEATVPFAPRNKNPFKSMYFAVQSMAAELSTAAPALLAMRGCGFEVALIITKNEAYYYKKAKSRLRFSCRDYPDFVHALTTLNSAGDTAEVTAKTVGTDQEGNHVATFMFTWSFKRKS